MPRSGRARPALVSFLQRQRWFGGKARGIDTIDVVDEGPLGPRATINIVEVRFADAGVDRYFVPLASAEDGDVIVDAVLDDEACRALVGALAAGRTVSLARGRVRASSGSAASESAASADLPVRRTAPDQSNTSIVFGDELIMKVFRRVEPGINPDVEVSRFLTARGFTRIPGLVADADYESAGGGCSSVLMLQQFVPNQGNAWQAILADGGPSSIALAETLGRRTGELHEALASDPDDPAFAAERYTAADLVAVADAMRSHGARQLDLLRRSELDEGSRRLAAAVLDRQGSILAGFDVLRDVTDAGSRIRCHGDFHLGQTLVADGDVFLLDFEGEPARPLAERRMKSSPLRDVAGMLRSLSYARQASHRDAAWEREVARAFLDGYRDVTDRADFLPPRGEAFEAVLDAFVLDKTLYELGYELNNRPDWVYLPLSALTERTRALAR